MVKCFCGCGRKVSSFTMRGANRGAQATGFTLVMLEGETLPLLEAVGSREKATTGFTDVASLIEAGHDYLGAFQAIIHDGADPETTVPKAEFHAWRHQANFFIRGLRELGGERNVWRNEGSIPDAGRIFRERNEEYLRAWGKDA